jgi:hypothetical protein
LVTINGTQKQFSDFRGRANLLLILTGGGDYGLLDAIAQSYSNVVIHETHVIAFLKCSPAEGARIRDSRQWPFEVVADPGGALHRRLGSEDESGASGLAVYITDRWAEVFYVCRTIHGDAEPNAAELLDWITFVDHQCPECFPREWPA